MRRKGVARSLQFERMLTYILLNEGLDAELTGGTNDLPDIRVWHGSTFFIELKMSRAQFGSGRIWYDGSVWRPTTAADPMAARMAREMDLSHDAHEFLGQVRRYVEREEIRFVRTCDRKRYESDPAIVRPDELSRFVDESGRKCQDIVRLPSQEISGIVRDHYLKGKRSPAAYIQWGDDFYRLTEDDPLGLDDVPLLDDIFAPIRIRLSFASDKRYYQFMPTIDPRIPVDRPSSPYSIIPWTGKIFPFSSREQSYVRPSWLLSDRGS